MDGEIVSLEEERSEREDTDPRAAIVDLQLREHGKQIAALTAEVGQMFELLRKVAKKIGVKS
jgi:hypothetical protein